jgi:tetratricopeptide (TPR) repeat protein
MQIKCTSCGATQELATNHQCGYCGSAIEQEKAQENYKTATSGEIGNLMMMAETAIDATNWEEALQYYNKTLEKDITNSDAWLGKGIAIVYTSKIGDIKTKEAIAYWKNALKHAENNEAMGKRVAKEINQVVNSFYPGIENHYIEFNELDNAYSELVSRFAILENALDYAVGLDSNELTYLESGYNLCKRVIEVPKKIASAQSGSALAEGILGQFTSNEYSRKYAAQDARAKMNKANDRKKEIEKAYQVIQIIQEKYFNKITKIDKNHYCVNEVEQIKKEKLDAVNTKQKMKYIYFGFFVGIGFLVLLLLLFGELIRGLEISDSLNLLIVLIFGGLGSYFGNIYYNKNIDKSNETKKPSF